MGNNFFTDKTLLLEAGNTYLLEITGMIEMSYSESWFVGMDENGLKHLIPASVYACYGINPGSRIMCRLDKINCQGRFFFEPKHPEYSEGKSYGFELVKIVKCSGLCSKYAAVVKDVFGNEILTRCFDASGPLPHNLDTIECYVHRIKKAVPYLQVTDKRLIGS